MGIESLSYFKKPETGEKNEKRGRKGRRERRKGGGQEVEEEKHSSLTRLLHASAAELTNISTVSD